MAKLILSAFADEYNRDIDVQIAMLQEREIPYLEPRFIGSRNISELSMEEVKGLKSRLENIKVFSIGSPLGKINLADDFAAHCEVAKRVFDTANVLDAKCVRMFSFYLHKGKSKVECRAEVIDKIGQMIDLAKKYDITLCHENEAEIYGESPDNCLDLMETFGGELNCVFDMGNFVLGGFKPFSDAYQKLKNYIRYFHIKDALALGAVVPPGCGEGCICEILSSYLNEFERDVLITLEPHLQTFDGLNALVGRSFENPYKYETQEIAFLDALNRMEAMMDDIYRGVQC